MSDPGPEPKIPYWHLWTDEDGVSHQARCALDAWELKGVGAADSQWNDKQDRVDSTVVFTVQPVGWVGDWHENPAPQWIVVLSGAWWVESMDGTRVEMAARVLAGRGPGLQQDGWKAGPPLRHHRQPAGGADDGATAPRPHQDTLPHPLA